MAYIGRHRRRGIGNSRRRRILASWGGGHGYPIPGIERQRGSRHGWMFNARNWLHPPGGRA